MSKPTCTPHIVTVYAIIDTEKGQVLRVQEVVQKPSKNCAEKYASSRRKDPCVTSAQVTPLGNRVQG